MVAGASGEAGFAVAGGSGRNEDGPRASAKDRVGPAVANRGTDRASRPVFQARRNGDAGAADRGKVPS